MDEYNNLFKVTFIGEFGVGKTLLLERYRFGKLSKQ